VTETLNHSRHTRVFHATLGLWLLITLECAEAGTWFFDVAATAAHDDNLSRAELSDDTKGDAYGEVSGSAGQVFQLTGNTTLVMSASGRYVRFDTYDGLNRWGAAFDANVRHKFGLGRDVPWASLGFSVEHQDFDKNVRDSWFYSTGLRVGKTLGERLDLFGGLSYLVRRADHSRGVSETDLGPEGEEESDGFNSGGAFDLDGWQVSLGADFFATQQLAISAAYAYYDGDVVSSSTPYHEIVEYATAITRDPAFGGDFYAFRLEAKSHTYSLDLNYALGRDSSIGVGYERMQTKGDYGNDYDSNIVRVTLMANF
jgi:hypothetical protein